jgi:metal-dependent hydrolase (beta-lactamase superfamily II)
MAPAPTTEPSATPLSTAEPAPAGPSEELTGAQISTLSSLQQVDDYPLYVMHYQGDYESLVAQWQDRARVDVMEPAASLAGWACSLFAALGDEGAMLYGRNFDWRFSPGLLLFTEPPDGYASVSMVDIEYLGFGAGNAENLADREPEDLQDLLYAPWLPFDGMNETGLAVGMAAVPAGGVRPDPDKETIDSLAVIREILDHAGTVDEALAILQGYNIEWGGGPPLHYLVAGTDGGSVLVEFYQGEMRVLTNEHPWQVATNFLVSSVSGSPHGRCWRYDTVSDALAGARGQISRSQAMDLLSNVAQENTQWSVVYDIGDGSVGVVMGQMYDQLHTFHLRQPASTASQGTGSLRMVTVYDNTALQSDLQADWGFGAWLEYGGHIVLFDTGANGRILLSNMEALGLDPQQIEAIVLSHKHGDHTGGLDALLDTGIRPVVYVPRSFPQAWKRDVQARTELVEVKEPIAILPGLFSTGEIQGAVREQGLVVETAGGLVVITGCAHPRIVTMVEAALDVVAGDIALVIGGFHLGQTSEGGVRRIVADFRSLGVQRVSPTHCTGDRAIAIFAEEYGDDYVPGGVGQVYVVGAGQP